MKQSVRRIFTMFVLLAAPQLQASTNQTFMLPRSHGVNLAMEQPVFWELAHREGEKEFGGNLQVTGFYSEAADRGKLGRYFGVNDKSTFVGAWPYRTIDAGLHVGGVGNDPAGTADFDLGIMIHDASLVGDPRGLPVNILSLRPSHTAYGVRFDYYQDLACLFEGLYLRFNVPVVQVENSLGLSAAGPNAEVIKRFFRGELNVDADGDGPISGDAHAGSQKALTNGLITGRHGKGGVADIDIELGYIFLHKDRYHASINLGLVVPTGNHAHGEYAFEPIYGNAHHFGLGAGLDWQWRMWGDYHTNLKMQAVLDFRYIFENHSKRTLGIVSDGLNVGSPNGNMAQYYLLADRTQNINAQQFTPAANLLTQPVNVKPGCELDGIAGFTYNCGNWSFDLGYNLYYRQRESVKMRNAWNDDAWVFVNPILATNDPAAPTANFGRVTAEVIDVRRAETPEQLTNKVYASAGYLFRQWRYPAFIGAGGHYEMASGNSAVENWGVNLKIGIGF